MSDFKRLTVEGFSLYDGENASRHFEEAELLLDSGSLGRSGTVQAMVHVSLGVGDADCHIVQTDLMPGRYDNAHHAVTEAISALEVIRDQLAVMLPTPEARAAEKNAFDLGVEAERAGLSVPTQEVRA